MSRSQAFRRPPRFARAKVQSLTTVPSESGELSGEADEDEEEDEEGPAFLTFSSHGMQSEEGS